MVYQDHLTKYCILRPSTSKRAAEVAFQLMDIFLMFGAPQILHSDNGSEFTALVISELKLLWPDLLIVHGKPRHPQSQGSVERLNCDIKDMLISWDSDDSAEGSAYPVSPTCGQNSKGRLHQLQEDIALQRSRVSAGQLAHAERMVKRSRLEHVPGDPGDNVTIPIPLVDRGKGDPRNVIGVILDRNENDMYRISVRDGILKGH
ncbi:uncharacterized protein [Palaemon carinicauda]|uniref:uncharacterized protein n=1 Tax=Palaemon carinicauda TaxID=392227 RepID=UPI0035B64034